MDATRSLSSSRRKKSPTPFYEAPKIRTSAQIIAEARKSVRSLPTDRPYTPANSGRILFGSRDGLSRPPSVFSIGAHHFADEKPSRPPTGQKLVSIEKQLADSDVTVKVSSRLKPTPPTPTQSYCDLSNTLSIQRHSKPPIQWPSAIQTAVSHSTTMVGGLESTSGCPLNSAEAGGLEPKPSTSSPQISKRSLSAGHRVLSGGKKRVVSAGDERETTRSRGTVADSTGTRRSKAVFSDDKSDLRSSSKPDSKKTEAVAFWDAEVAPLLSELETTSSDNVNHLCQVCEVLWSTLEQRDLLGRTGGAGGSKRRGTVLRTVFRLLDHKDSQLLLKVARIIIAMKVTGKNLLNVCKLLFALGKNDTNDNIFRDEHILGPLIDLLSVADPLTNTEAMVYGLGTIKLLASNSELRDQLASAGVMKLLASTLQKCTEGSNDSTSKLHIANILVQLTAALRNLSESPSVRSEFLSTSLIPHLASALSDHLSNSDIVFNISRLLRPCPPPVFDRLQYTNTEGEDLGDLITCGDVSKLTLHTECQAAVVQCPSFLPLFLQTLTIHSSSADIIVRVCFILGNLTASDSCTREQLFFSHGTLPILNNISNKYFTVEQNQPKEKTAKSLKKPVSKSEDVLIKLVRLVANLSVHPKVGPAIACDEASVHQLLRILSCMPLLLYEELVLNTLATLNNLSYYAEPDSCVVQRQQEVAELLVSIVLEDSNDGLLECTRVYGNLSRYPTVRRILAEKKVNEVMVMLLDSGRREMVFCSCGVLINLMADAHHRTMLRSNGGVRKLVDVLRDFGRNDWQLSSLVCKTLWNYSEQLTSAASCFGEEEMEQLIELLESYSSEMFALQLPPDMPEGTKQALHASWQNDFLPVAQNLLARIQSHRSNYVPLEQCTGT